MSRSCAAVDAPILNRSADAEAPSDVETPNTSLDVTTLPIVRWSVGGVYAPILNRSVEAADAVILSESLGAPDAVRLNRSS